MTKSANSLAQTMEDAVQLVGVDHRTIKLAIENGTTPKVQPANAG